MAFRYVVLHHTGWVEDHFDLVLEIDVDGPLRTWRCPAWPLADAATAEPLADHRRAYLEYEGEVSGGRGRVRRVEAGTYESVDESADRLAVVLGGRSLLLSKRPVPVPGKTPLNS